MLKKTPFFLLAFLASTFGFCQSTDILRAEYTVLPKTETDIEVARYRFLINIPLKLTTDKYLVTGAEYKPYRF